MGKPNKRMNKEQHIKTMLITPELAAQWLKELEQAQEKGLFRQRPPRTRAIQRYAQDMKAGKWVETHQGIAFDVNGRLSDGQNRLWAIVRSGCTVSMKVTFNVPVEAMDVIDGGMARSLGEALKIGHNFGGNAGELGTLARQIINMTVTGRGGTTRGAGLVKGRFVGVQVSTSEALLVLDELGYRSSYERFCVLVPSRKMRRAPIAAPWCWYHMVRPKLADKFAVSYATLEGLEKGSPPLALFKYFNNSKLASKNYELQTVSSRAIQAFDEGQPIMQLGPSRESLLWLVKLNPTHTDKIIKRVLL